ncbi:hypothetical protein K469DRAFT_686102 [Zopfia rhizophila CBS 207.26]|uniref:Uncharacterized protein n=1 Tax=Zopfia rhizophila CBS 207.26 TaxID=1314779 RepID=A0A6A6E8G4_9PEZI|nr:hypothetical protein K469DRAFT_686102 [Zopfia rhizophila CBS 207.26]
MSISNTKPNNQPPDPNHPSDPGTEPDTTTPPPSPRLRPITFLGSFLAHLTSPPAPKPHDALFFPLFALALVYFFDMLLLSKSVICLFLTVALIYTTWLVYVPIKAIVVRGGGDVGRKIMIVPGDEEGDEENEDGHREQSDGGEEDDRYR